MQADEILNRTEHMFKCK